MSEELNAYYDLYTLYVIMHNEKKPFNERFQALQRYIKLTNSSQYFKVKR